MPEYVTNPDTDDESIIMVGDIEDLKSGKISTGNSISVDTNVAQYAHLQSKMSLKNTIQIFRQTKYIEFIPYQMVMFIQVICLQKMILNFMI